MNEKKFDSEQKNENKKILKLSLSSVESDSDKNNNEEDKSDNGDIKKKISKKNTKILNSKKFKEDDNSNYNSFIKSNKEEKLHEFNSSDYTNEKEITIGKLYSYRNRRKLIFVLICLINILINCDHGAIPAGTKELKEAKNLSNIQLGTIGSLVYLGLIFGSISGGYIFSTYSSKWVIIISLIATCAFLYFFTVSDNYITMSSCRVGCGFFQVFCYIYFPIWVDQFGVNKLIILKLYG